MHSLERVKDGFDYVTLMILVYELFLVVSVQYGHLACPSWATC